MHRQLRALLGGLDNFVHMAQLQLRVNALAVQIQRHGNDVHVAGTLTVPHQRAFYTVSAGHHAKLRRRHGTAAVVVRVQRNKQAVSIGHSIAEPLDLVGIDIRRTHLDGRGKVNNHRVLGGRLPYRGDGIAGLYGKIQLGTGKALR